MMPEVLRDLGLFLPCAAAQRQSDHAKAIAEVCYAVLINCSRPCRSLSLKLTTGGLRTTLEFLAS